MRRATPSADVLASKKCMPCRGGCGRYLWRSRRRDRPSGTYRHEARGLCSPCHKVAAENDTLLDFEPLTMPVEFMIEDIETGADPVVLLKGWGKRAETVHRALMRADRKDLARLFASLANTERKTRERDAGKFRSRKKIRGSEEW